jgi:hypothetical protein
LKIKRFHHSECYRLTVWTYESVLRNECGYTGAQPYWDYTLDTPENGGHFVSSPIFDPVYGFGGGGGVNAAPTAATAAPVAASSVLASPVKTSPAAANNVTTSSVGTTSPKSATTPKGTSAPKGPAPKGGSNGARPCAGFGSVCGSCVTDGPFAKYKVYIGPGNTTKPNPRCLTRNLNGQVAEAGAAQKALDRLMAKDKYEQFQTLDTSAGGFSRANAGQFVPGIHSVGHMGVGGEVRPYSDSCLRSTD